MGESHGLACTSWGDHHAEFSLAKTALGDVVNLVPMCGDGITHLHLKAIKNILVIVVPVVIVGTEVHRLVDNLLNLVKTLRLKKVLPI